MIVFRERKTARYENVWLDFLSLFFLYLDVDFTRKQNRAHCGSFHVRTDKRSQLGGEKLGENMHRYTCQ